jgi:hypothetical protein
MTNILELQGLVTDDLAPAQCKSTNTSRDC